MSADVPVFLYMEKRKGGATAEKFLKDTKDDIQAVLDLLIKRGMWSKYHYDKWSAELADCNSEEVAHLWWDAIVGGAMLETESRVMEAIEAGHEKAEEMAEKKVEMKMSSFAMDGMGPHKKGKKLGDMKDD